MAGATMADVARVAGVSKQTVSRVINDHPNVSAHTRKLVEDAVQRLDYRPNAVARLLATRDSASVGVVSANLTLYGPGQIVRGIEHAARARGYFTSIAGLVDDAADVEDVLERFFDQAFDAVILVDVDDQLQMRTGGLTTAKHLINAPYGSHDGDFWQADRTAVREATEHLVALGHRCIAHVGGPTPWPSARERARGWRDALDAAGLPAGPLLRSGWSAEGGYAAGASLSDRPEVTAVVAASDDIALGVIAAYAAAGLSVPRDLSVVGYDGTPSSAYFLPALTTVACDFRRLGERYVDALDVAFGGEPQTTTEPLTRLIVRASTARLPEGT